MTSPVGADRVGETTVPETAVAAFAHHGGRLSRARLHFPTAPEPWVDLSTGISPWPYTIPALPVECWTRLPEPEHLTALTAAAREAYRAHEAATVVALPGTDLAIQLIPRLVRKSSRVAIVSPTYSTHGTAWRACGHDVVDVATPDDVTDCDIGVVVNPNNPDGRRWEPAVLRTLAQRLGSAGGFLVVDEAFADATPDASVLDTGEATGHLIVLRSFGKFFGLAGLRLGFVITGHAIGDDLAAVASAWPVSGVAVAVGQNALRDRAWAAAARRRMERGSGELTALLQASGLTDCGGTALFRLASDPRGHGLFEHLARAAILTRPFASGTKLRFGLPANSAQFARLSVALAQWRR